MTIIYALAKAVLTLSILKSSFAQFNSISYYDFPSSEIDAANSLARDEFPKNFKFGVSMASYQNEGAWNVSDKAPTIWDYAIILNSTHTTDGSISNGATDFYHRYKEDIQLAKSFGMNIMRISISWSRLLPTGFSNHISEDGVRFYNNVINELLANGITPMVTVFHGDTPYNIHRLGAFLNPLIIDLLTDYARVAFTLFGDRVKLWLSINELEAMCIFQNNEPDPIGTNLSRIIEYECFRNSLLAHASVYHMYKREFAASQGGKVGFTIENLWYVPKSDSETDTQAAYNGYQWTSGEIMNAVFSMKGDFPMIMRDRVNYLSYLGGYSKSRVPSFTDTEISQLRGSADFLGVNFYHARTAIPLTQETHIDHEYQLDISVGNVWRNPPTLSQSSPWALRQLFHYMKKNYDLPEMYITEVGYRIENGIQDPCRAIYFYRHLLIVMDLLKDGFDIKGFLLWTLTDNFSWHWSYSVKLGIVYIDFDDATLPRTPKMSSKVVSSIFHEKRIKPLFEILTDSEDILAVRKFIPSFNSSSTTFNDTCL